MRVLLVSIDGLAADYFERHGSELPSVQQLAAEGAPLRCRAVAPSVTWPGHASIVTGAAPRRHGVVGNLAWNRRSAAPAQLYLEKDWHGDGYLVPTVFHVIKAEGGLAAALSWPSARGLTHHSIVDTDDTDVIRRDARPELLEAALGTRSIEALRPPNETQGLDAFTARDGLLARATQWLLPQARIQLVAVQLSSLDFALHHFGSESPEVRVAARAVDDLVAKLVHDASVSDMAVVVTGDHGHTPVRRKVFPNEDLERAGLLFHGSSGSRVIGNGGSGWLYGLGPDSRADAHRAAALLTEAGYRVVAPDAFDDHGESSELGTMVGDYLVGFGGDAVIASGVTDGEPRDVGMVSSHGHLPDDPAMDAQAVLWGPGITGLPNVTASLTDLAPRMAALIGVPFAGRSGLVDT